MKDSSTGARGIEVEDGCTENLLEVGVNNYQINELIDTYPLKPLSKANAKKWQSKIQYCTICGAFDIETTNLDLSEDNRQAFCYHWQFQLGYDWTITGRTIQTARWFLDQVSDRLQREGKTLLVWVHNLSFEFQFLAGVHCFSGSEVLCMEPRKILKAEWGGIEFRCSYLQYGGTFDKLCTDYKVKHHKLDGEEFNYRVIRYPWTPLKTYEKTYCLNDVRGLVEGMTKRCLQGGDDWYSMPYTKTGYVRREMKKALHWRLQESREEQEDFYLYKLFRQAFRGGNTHANRYFAGRVIKDVKSFDRVSSYPDVMLNCPYPDGRWRQRRPDEFEELYKSGKDALLLVIRFHNVTLQDQFWGFPYIPLAKIRYVKNPVLDNGRIISADSFEMTLTDIDMDIISGEYNFDYDVMEVWRSHYEALPSQLLNLVRYYYKGKTELKGVEGKEEEYSKRKENLNSLYGMMVQDPGKPEIIFDGTDYVEDQTDGDEDHYHKSVSTTPLLYCWGVWVTAWARYRLEEGLVAAGEGAIYTDTDSVKYHGSFDIESFNLERIKENRVNGGVAVDRKGKEHILGVFEEERPCKRFVTFGAKKYAYEDPEGGLHITIAGVNKKKGAAELREAGGIESLKEDFRFSAGGGTISVYNDTADFVYKDPETGKPVQITRNVYIGDSTYTVGLTPDYRDIIRHSRLIISALNRRLVENQEVKNV